MTINLPYIMKSILRHICSALAVAAVAAPLAAQELRTSYFAETSNFKHQINPALLDNAYMGMPFFGNIHIGTTGNVGLKNFVYKNTGANSARYPLTTFMSPTVSASQFLDDLHDKNRMDIYLNYNVASVAFKGFGGINLVELNVRSNTHLSLPKELFDFMKSTGARDHYDLSGVGMRTQNYAELALGHSRNITDKLRVGAKMKLLFGLAYGDFDVKRLDLTLSGDQWKAVGDARLDAAIMSSKFLPATDKPHSPDGRPRVDDFDVQAGLAGFGLAFDLGATYKLLPDLTLSASITDLGFISYGKAQHASSAGEYTFDGFENDIYVSGENNGTNKLGDQFKQMGDDLEEIFSVYDDGESASRSALAATINLGAEYTLPAYRKLRFGFLYTSRICGKYSWHEGMFSANCRPLKWIEANFSVAATSTGITCGGLLNFHAPHFNFYVGTDRFFGKVSKEFIPLNHTNAGINIGMTFPLGKQG